MKKQRIILMLLQLFTIMHAQAKTHAFADTLKSSEEQSYDVDSFSYKIGVKIISEQSGDYSIKPFTNPVHSAGVQLIKPIDNTSSSIESGLYMIMKASERKYYTYEYYWDTVRQVNSMVETLHPIIFHYYNLSMPVNYRCEISSFYLSGGLMFDYLIGESNDGTKAGLDSIHYNHEEMRKFNWGYNLTAGAEWDANAKLCFFAELRYAKTLSSSETTGGNFFFDPSYLNLGFAIGANYKFYKQCR